MTMTSNDVFVSIFRNNDMVVNLAWNYVPDFSRNLSRHLAGNHETSVEAEPKIKDGYPQNIGSQSHERARDNELLQLMRALNLRKR